MDAAAFSCDYFASTRKGHKTCATITICRATCRVGRAISRKMAGRKGRKRLGRQWDWGITHIAQFNRSRFSAKHVSIFTIYIALLHYYICAIENKHLLLYVVASFHREMR